MNKEIEAKAEAILIENGITYYEKEYIAAMCEMYESALKGIDLDRVVYEWKSVKEFGKPEYNVGVLVFIPDENFHITSGMWDVSNKWVLLDEYRVPDCEVTHWMELPSIPKEYQKEQQENNDVMNFLAKHKHLLKGGKD